MRFQIERTLLKEGSGLHRDDTPAAGVECFIERGESPREAVRRFLRRDQSILTDELITMGSETVGTVESGDRLYLLRLHVVEDRA